MRKRIGRAPAIVLLLAAMLPAARAVARKAWLFAYFQEPGDQGIDLALSYDGYHFTPLNGGNPWVKPAQPGEVMRDVFLTHGPDGKYRMVWTWSWRGDSLGYAESPDLLHWGPQQKIPIMRDFPDVRNVWAPEIYWDAPRSQWMILWSSALGQNGRNHIWCSFTKDFRTFTKPKIFFDPGYEVIDATIFHARRKGAPYRLIFKDQHRDPLSMQVRFAIGPTLEGPWTRIHEPVTQSWSEGPSAIEVHGHYILYYDHYRAPRARYEAVESADWIHWKAINGKIGLPAHAKHGSFLEISPAEAKTLATVSR